MNYNTLKFKGSFNVTYKSKEKIMDLQYQVESITKIQNRKPK